MAVSTQHCTSMVGRAAVQQQYYLQASDTRSGGGGSKNARDAYRGRMLGSAGADPSSRRRGAAAPAAALGGDGEQQRSRAAVFLRVKWSGVNELPIAFFFFFSPEPSGKPAGPNSHTRRAASFAYSPPTRDAPPHSQTPPPPPGKPAGPNGHTRRTASFKPPLWDPPPRGRMALKLANSPVVV